MEESTVHGGAAGRVRLNLGAGEHSLPGFHNLDAKTGDALYPLAWPDNSVDEIRASHVLEHFGRAEIQPILREWVRCLKPGGTLKVAVPNFQTIAEWYLAGQQAPIEGYLMGGQTDALDFHKTIFDREELYTALRQAGLIAVRQWTSEIQDCAALPVSLNLMATKPGSENLMIRAVMSVPRLGFMDNFFCAFEALGPNGVKLAQVQGAFWGQCLTRGIEKALSDGADIVLTADYDTIYTARHVALMAQIMRACPEIDALAPLQSARHHAQPLMTVRDENGNPRDKIELAEMMQDIMPAETAHFGLTMIRRAALERMPKPWFVGVPDEDGRWEDGRIDDDVNFWRKWRACGNTLFIANRVAVGHAELLIRWPGKDLSAVMQAPRDFRQSGPPKECWE